MRPERAALVAAILEKPEDDSIRLVAADWFEEQRDDSSVARAEFIRTQVARARLPIHDEQQAELEARELRLLKQWAPVWCAPHFFRKVRFRRGFIEYVHLHLNHFLHHRRQLLALEPVRDISLTGWFRAPEHLYRNVAACEEWRHIETLRIHHQGPHKDPPGLLVKLLESPHLTRLKGLHCSMVNFEADARRRFEQLPLLHRLEQLSLPYLDTYPNNPGPWFSDGGIASAREWQRLRILRLPPYVDTQLIQQLAQLPFWMQLEELNVCVSRPEYLANLRERLPAGLRRLVVPEGASPSQLGNTDSFVERLKELPLETLHIFPVSGLALGRLLDGNGRCRFKHLTLDFNERAPALLDVVASSPAMESVGMLTLNAWDTDDTRLSRLLSSDHLCSIVHLDVSGTHSRGQSAFGRRSAAALTSPHWRALRVLQVYAPSEEALTLLGRLQRLTWLGICEAFKLTVSAQVASLLARLPYLSALRLEAKCDAAARQVLQSSGSLAWPLIMRDDEPDEKAWREDRAPERWPPVDVPIEQLR